MIPVKRCSWLEKAKERIARERAMELRKREASSDVSKEDGNAQSKKTDVQISDTNTNTQATSLQSVSSSVTESIPSSVTQSIASSVTESIASSVTESTPSSTTQPTPSSTTQPTPSLSAEDEARLSLLRDLVGPSSSPAASTLLIPLRAKSTDGAGSTASQNRLPGLDRMVCFRCGSHRRARTTICVSSWSRCRTRAARTARRTSACASRTSGGRCCGGWGGTAETPSTLRSTRSDLGPRDSGWVRCPSC